MTQNNKFVVSMQHLKKEVSDKIDFFFRVDKHESFAQIDTMIFDGDSQALPKFPM